MTGYAKLTAPPAIFILAFRPQVHEDHISKLKELIKLYGGTIKHSQHLWMKFEIDEWTLFWLSTKNDPFIQTILKATPAKR